jgi:large subunit ribosomal protein L30
MATTAKKTITVVQTASAYGKGPGMRATVLGLGLGRIGWKRDLEDTPAVRGMVARVKHLVKIEEKKGK